MTPATIATATPLPSDFAFSAISVFASSISSRTSSDALVETSFTASPSDFSAVLPFSVIVTATECLQELREHERAREGGDHRKLGAADRVGGLVGRQRRLVRAIAGSGRFGAGFHHSGGSSSKSLTQIAVAKRVVAIVATAPSPASRPLQTRRFTNSFCISAGTLTGDRGRLGARQLEASADGLDDQRLGLLEVLFALRDDVEDPARQQLLDCPVEHQGGEVG